MMPLDQPPSLQANPYLTVVVATFLIGGLRRLVAGRASAWAETKAATVHGQKWVEANKEKVSRARGNTVL